MIDTLRQRLIVSHVLPLLIIIPVLGISLMYILETQILLPSLSVELIQEAAIITELGRDHVSVWQNPGQAQVFVTRLDPLLGAQIILLDSHGRILASNNPNYIRRLGQFLPDGGTAAALQGDISVRTTYSRDLQAEIADVASPVFGPERQVIGVVRLSHQFIGVQGLFLRLRYLILGILAAGLILGTGIGWLLALNMERPLRGVTQAIFDLATTGKPMTRMVQRGPAEIRLLLGAVNSLVERLRILEQARRQLLANMVHELGRPLGALRAAVQALRDGAVDDTSLRQELISGMLNEFNRLRRLLDNLAELHDQVLGALELERSPITLNDWLGQVLPAWREAALRKGLRWEASIPSDADLTLEADSDRLAQALGNLVSNAIKYTPPGGTVSVNTGREHGCIWLRVSDTGPGIPAEEQAHLFTPFYRGPSTNRFPQGMGLGLTIARDLVAAHGGKLDLETTPGQGSHFTIRLPDKQKTPPA
jgi:two-component system sensor histidine kinase BaeS